jgi:HSP20 family protein
MNGDLQTSPIRFIFSESEELELYTSNLIHWQKNIKPHAWSPPTDLIESTDRLIIRIEIAGMKQADFSIRLDPRRVNVSGCRSESHDQGCYHRMEIASGDFESEIVLPHPVNVDQAVAEYRDGFLSIILPKIDPDQLD